MGKMDCFHSTSSGKTLANADLHSVGKLEGTTCHLAVYKDLPAVTNVLVNKGTRLGTVFAG